MSAPTLYLDLDGPILDVSDRYFRVFRDVLISLGSNCPNRAKGRYWRMKRDRRSTAEILEILSERPVRQSDFLNLWLERIELTEYLKLDTVQPGARGQLRQLGKSFDLVLVTLRQRQKNLRSQLQWLRLTERFRSVLSAPPLPSASWKIKRDLIASSAALPTARCIVGDSEVDIRAGKSLGLVTIAVLSGIRNRNALEEFAPDLIIKDLSSFNARLPAVHK